MLPPSACMSSPGLARATQRREHTRDLEGKRTRRDTILGFRASGMCKKGCTRYEHIKSLNRKHLDMVFMRLKVDTVHCVGSLFQHIHSPFAGAFRCLHSRACVGESLGKVQDSLCLQYGSI